MGVVTVTYHLVQMFSPGFFKESLGGFRTWLDDRKLISSRSTTKLTPFCYALQYSEMHGSPVKMRMF